MTRLAIDGLSYSSEGAPLLGPMSAEISLQGLTAILGTNGAGKTLFLQAVHGSLPGAVGAVRWDGAAARGSRASRGYVPQRPTVLRRSVYDNVAFAMQAVASAGGPMRPQVEATLETAQLHDLRDRPAAALSGGELRRMAMARALVTDPSALLLDEPFNGLDPQNHRMLETMLARARARGVPILMISHNIAQARRLADQVLFIDGGKITALAPAGEFFDANHAGTIAAYLDGQLT